MIDPKDVDTVLVQNPFDRATILRQQALQIAKDHGAVVTDQDMTPDREAHWLDVERNENKKQAEYLAKRRRSLVWSAVGKTIPEHYREPRPHLAVKGTPGEAGMKKLLAKRIYDTGAYKKTIATGVSLAKGELRTVLFTGLTEAGKTTLAAILLRMMAFHWHQEWRAGVVSPLERGILDGDPVFAKLLCAHRRDEAFTGAFGWVTGYDVATAQKKGPHHCDWMKSTPILVIDDVGIEPVQANLGGVEEIVWDRHDKNDSCITILTSGFCDPTQEDHVSYLLPLTVRYSAALVRRIASPGQSALIRCTTRPVTL